MEDLNYRQQERGAQNTAAQRGGFIGESQANLYSSSKSEAMPGNGAMNEQSRNYKFSSSLKPRFGSSLVSR